jgi:hypothetical protein
MKEFELADEDVLVAGRVVEVFVNAFGAGQSGVRVEVEHEDDASCRHHGGEQCSYFLVW